MSYYLLDYYFHFIINFVFSFFFDFCYYFQQQCSSFNWFSNNYDGCGESVAYVRVWVCVFLIIVLISDLG